MANNRLKGVYFVWADNYEGPPPRSLETNFKEYLSCVRYELFDENWLEKVLNEFKLSNEEDLDNQILIIEDDYNIYLEQQNKKKERRWKKKWNIHCAKCAKEGVLPF